MDQDYAAMDEVTTQESGKFPPGYGEFALQCSDGVVCHFPRYLLGYMSGFFKDMFSLPDSNPNDGGLSNPSEPLKVTESSETIELLLQHMDPKTRMPDIDPNTIISLLEAAQKYQVVSVTGWFEQEAKLKKVVVFEPSVESTRIQLDPLVVTRPLLVLYCGVRFDLPNAGRVALRELTQCDARLLQPTERDLPLHAYLHAMDLRNKRVEFFKSFITELAGLETDGGRGPRSSGSFGSSRGRGSSVPLTGMKRNVGIRDHERKTCVSCTATRSSWVLRIERAVKEEPSWRAFVAAYEKNAAKCGTCESSSWADYHRGLLEGWESRTVKIQRELPLWPF